mgnify:FL=1
MKTVLLHKNYKNKKNDKIYYTLEQVINKTENKISILYSKFPISDGQLYVIEQSQFLEKFNIYND